MIENQQYPPYLPDSRKNRNEVWISALSPFNPQFFVSNGPSQEEIRKSLSDGAKIKIRLEERTADFDEDEPNEVIGDYELQVDEIFEEDDAFHFMTHGFIPFSERPDWENSIWIYNYYPKDGYGAADIPAD